MLGTLTSIWDVLDLAVKICSAGFFFFAILFVIGTFQVMEGSSGKSKPSLNKFCIAGVFFVQYIKQS